MSIHTALAVFMGGSTTLYTERDSKIGFWLAIRRIFHKGECYFSILDVVRILTGTSNPRRYWPELKKQL